MTTRRSTLGRDEKALLCAGRKLGLEIAIVLLHRELARQPRACVDEDDDPPAGMAATRQLLPAAGQAAPGYLTK